MRFLLSSSANNLAAALADFTKTATVEAEYGDTTVQGTVITMAHHGRNAGQPAPCSYENMLPKVEAVGLSHLDLDALGGCLALMGIKPDFLRFWELASFIDLNGPHKLAEGIKKIGAGETDVAALHAFWAWSQENRVMPNRDGSVSDITREVMEAVDALRSCLLGEEEMIKAGEEFKAAGEKLNAESFVEAKDGVVVRVSPQFVNHLYTDPDGTVNLAVVAFNTTTGAITVSFADKPEPRGGALPIVQYLWGEKAGGHAGIAGSPRGKRMKLEDLLSAMEATREAVKFPFNYGSCHGCGHPLNHDLRCTWNCGND